MRNKIPRVGAGRGTQANWKAITGININSISVGVSDGNRGGVVSTAVQEYMAAYRGIGLEDFVSFEADYAAEGFDDLKATSCQGLLRAVMIGEEEVIVGGNTSLPLGLPRRRLSPICRPGAPLPPTRRCRCGSPP